MPKEAGCFRPSCTCRSITSPGRSTKFWTGTRRIYWLLCSVPQEPFSLIELGAGDGLKTKVLLRHFLAKKAQFSYVPIDISVDALDSLAADLRHEFADLSVEPQHDDYFNALERLGVDTGQRHVVLFLGSNVGNFASADAIDFYRQIADRLRPGDLMLTGFDLQKNPATIQAAYSDQSGRN